MFLLSKKLPLKHTSVKRSLHSPVRIEDIVSNPSRGIPPLWTKEGFHNSQKIYLHHVDQLNELTKDTVDEKFSLEWLAQKYYVNPYLSGEYYKSNLSKEQREKIWKIIEHTSEVYNYEIMFRSITANGVPPSEWMINQLNARFGSFDQFKKLFIKQTDKLIKSWECGEGWVWLVVDTTSSNLEIGHGHNVIVSVTPLIGCCLFEDAYLYDWNLNRISYIENYLKAVNWEKVETILKSLPRYKHVEFMTTQDSNLS